uniref:Uroporphyrinogen-III synthase n=1 Tax=Arundo donax TaxID=35708 RepID=A0A0A8Z8T0_ARUDO
MICFCVCYIVQYFVVSLSCRAWLNLISQVDNWNNSVACIGETTASATKKLGLKSIYYSSAPGFDGYAHIMMPFE